MTTVKQWKQSKEYDQKGENWTWNGLTSGLRQSWLNKYTGEEAFWKGCIDGKKVRKEILTAF